MFDVIDKETGERARGWSEKYEIEIFAMECSGGQQPLTADNLIEKLIEFAENPPPPAPELTRKEIEEVLNKCLSG